MQQGVVEWLTTVFGRLNKDPQVLDNVILSAEIIEFGWAQSVFKLLLGRREPFFPYIEIFIHVFVTCLFLQR